MEKKLYIAKTIPKIIKIIKIVTICILAADKSVLKVVAIKNDVIVLTIGRLINNVISNCTVVLLFPYLLKSIKKINKKIDGIKLIRKNLPPEKSLGS